MLIRREVTMPEHILHGCQSKPLASYLKALGILRLVSEQSDSTARGSWQHGVFCLSCRMDREALLDFFLEGYRPSPLVSPWNGGSGFYPGDNKAGIEAVSASDDVRLSVYREAIACIFNWPEFRELEALPSSKRKAYGEQIKKGKERILQRCRSTLPDECLPWLDAAYALREDKAFFPPLLGTGGNEGRLEFSNNFMQRVCELFHKTPADLQEAWLKASLFDVPVSSLPVIKVGQFDPGNAGGINQSMAFKNEDVQSNPWDFIFMLEGTLLFASALVRRSPNDMAQAAAPFSVSSLSAGFASSHLQDKGRGEVWMPLWSHPATVRELRRLLGEGRASLGREQVREGLDFARAAALLGVDRGIDGFERFSLLERRGQSYVALPSGTVSVGWRQPVALLDSVGEYLKLRPLVKEDRLPASFTSARRRLTEAVFQCTEKPDAAHFIEVSRCLARLDALSSLPSLMPRPCRLPAGWIEACDDGSPEVRLAAAIASLRADGELGPMRAHLAPVKPGRVDQWDENSAQYVPWRGEAWEGMAKMLQRRLMDAQRFGASPWEASVRLSPADLLPLLEGRVDGMLLADLVRAFSLVLFSSKQSHLWQKPLVPRRLPYAIALLKALHMKWPKDMVGFEAGKLGKESRITSLVGAGRLAEACTVAAQRMRAAGVGNIFVPSNFEESVRGIQPLPLLVSLLVPIRAKEFVRNHLDLHIQS